MILIDTNIFIEIYRNNTSVAAIVNNMSEGEIAVCDVIRAELFFGARNKRELAEISEDIDELIVLPIVSQISEMAVQLVKSFCLSHKLELADALIAATAIYHNIELYTLNIKDFIFIPGIKFYNDKIH
jgi:predicted nucleic acid-binding protein